MNSVLGNHHPTPSHGPDGAVPTVADDVGEPAPLWPHDPEAKEVSRLAQTWAGGLRGLLVSLEATAGFPERVGKFGCLILYEAWGGSVRDTHEGPCPKETGGLNGLTWQTQGTHFNQIRQRW